MLRSALLSVLVLVLAPLTLAQQPRAGDDAAARRPFLRLIENAQGGRLEALVATYRRGDASLTLYGCVHVADASFYAEMQQRFRRHDALLYELVGPSDMRPYPEMEVGEGEHWISTIQGGMGRGLKLADQFGAMDYRQDNFVHADMTEQEWQDALAAAGKSELGELLSAGPEEVDREAEAAREEIDLVGAFRSGGGVAELRIVMARMMLSGDPAVDQPTVIIHGRNEKCLRVLQQQLDAGARDLGIFYGAAHMEHLERRLTEDLGWTKAREEWVLAWDCSYQRWPKQERGLKQKRYRARRDLNKLWAAVHELVEQRGGEVSWQAVRAAQADGKLPGRADGLDPWGRAYVLRRAEDGWEVRCRGSDGVADTADDLRYAGAQRAKR